MEDYKHKFEDEGWTTHTLTELRGGHLMVTLVARCTRWKFHQQFELRDPADDERRVREQWKYLWEQYQHAASKWQEAAE